MSRLLVALLFLSAAARSFAGSDAAATSAGSQAPADGGTFYSPLPAKVQEDLGDIRPAEAAGIMSYVHVEAQVNAQYTSNASLYHSRDDADFLIAPAVRANLTLPLNKNFDLNVEARLEDFTYSSHQDLGFWGFAGEGLLEYHYKPAWPRLYVGVEPYYYFSYANGDRLTSAIGPVAGVDQTFSLDRGKTLLFLGYHFGEYVSTPNIDTRQSHTVTASITQQLERNLYAQLYWQLQYSNYSVYGRDETRDVVGMSFIHQFTPKAYGSLFVNYIDNASNNSLAKYETVNVGFSLLWQF
jgi:hypothetical protein